MQRRLFRTGSGYAFFVPKTIIELLSINPEKDMLELTIENKKLIIEKAKTEDISK